MLFSASVLPLSAFAQLLVLEVTLFGQQDIAAADIYCVQSYQPGRQPIVTAIVESLLNLPHRLYQVMH